jgi:hypothetical protein
MRLSKLEREFLKKPQPTFDEWVKGEGSTAPAGNRPRNPRNTNDGEGKLENGGRKPSVEEYGQGSSQPPGRSTQPIPTRARATVRCGARTRKTGRPCRARPAPGLRADGTPRTRCKWHGGCSTGARTRKGRQRISAAMKKYWEGYRLAQAIAEKK